MLIGRSLSLCVIDICKGLVKEEAVTKIIAGTNCKNYAEFLELMDKFRKTYWKSFPKQAIEIALSLFQRGRIEQPRTEGRSAESNVMDYHWMDENGNPRYFKNI